MPTKQYRPTEGAVAVALATLLVGCAAPESANTVNQTRYALGVESGQCPPDVAFYHAATPAARTELGVLAARDQIVSYRVTSDDPE